MSTFAPGIASKDFTPGTSSKITADQAVDLIAKGLRTSRPQVNAKTITPVYAMAANGEFALKDGVPQLVGFEVVHAEPAQRKPRSDKGKVRASASKEPSNKAAS